MGELTTGMASALAGDRPIVFGAVQLALPAETLRLLDGAGEVMIDGEVYRGAIEHYGAIGGIDGLEDGAGDSAGEVRLTLLPGTTEGLGLLGAAINQGAPVTIMMGVIDPATGLPVPEPYTIFAGEVDQPEITWGERRNDVTLRLTSVFERFFELEEGIRLSDAWHQSVWPGELGLSFVTGVAAEVPWGTEKSSVVKK